MLKGKRYTYNQSPEEFNNLETGIFEDKVVSIDGNVVTAKPNGYVDFALELGKMMDIYDDDADYQETVDFFKYFKA